MLLQLFAMHKLRSQASSDYISDVFDLLDPSPQHCSCIFRFKWFELIVPWDSSVFHWSGIKIIIMEPPSVEFSWNCTCCLPYRRFIQQATKKRKKEDSQKQPSKLKEYAAVKIVGRRTSNNTPRRQVWSFQSYIFCVVGWVEVAWQQIFS